MPTSNNFKQILHRKQWSNAANPRASLASTQQAKTRLANQFVYSWRAAATLDLYSITDDSWISMPTPGMANLTAGACMETSAMGPSGTATAGSTTALTTNLTIPIDLRGYRIRITGGPGAGDERTILSNTIGANSVITVTSAFSTTITTSSTYTLLTGSLYLFSGGTLAANSFRRFDYATQTYTNLSITGLPATFGTDGCLVATPSIIDLGNVYSHATGTATAGAATTITNGAKNWATNQWANAFQVRITGGTGAGQTRIISSNTGQVITVASAWTTNPDATSVYSIEGNDDYLYLLGNGATTLYRYSIAGNSWTTLSPGTPRSGSVSSGLQAAYPCRVPASDWTSENAIINGRRLYSFRGGGQSNLDYYDIPGNTWVNGLAYGPGTILPSTGWKSVEFKGDWFIRDAATATSTAYLYRYDFETNQMLPWSNLPIFGNQTGLGPNMFVGEYVDGVTSIPFVYVPIDNTNFPQMLRSYIGL